MDESLKVAQEIRNQIGPRALFMIGARTYVAGVKSLQFQVGKNPHGATTIVVKLTESDDYTVESWVIRAGNAARVRKIGEITGVWAGELAQAIEVLTGMAVKL